MSGRRIRTAVLDTLDDAGIDYAVISGLSNGFVHYLTTREEYSQQYYEGASTVFGPWSQEALTQELERIAAGIGEPNDIAYMVLYLASDESKHVTGAELVVDNGDTVF